MTDLLRKSTDGPKQSPTLERSRALCYQCRQDKQKCVPKNRDWDKQERCLRCIRLGHPCGPSEIKPRRRSQNTGISSSNSTFDVPGNLHTHFSTAVPDALTTSNVLSSSTVRHRTKTNGHSACFEDDARKTMRAFNGTNQPFTTTGRKHYEREGRKVLKRLGDLKALRKNFLLDMELVNELEWRLSPSFSFGTHRSRLKAVISAIGAETVTLFNNGVALLSEDMGSHKEYFLSKLSSLMEDFRNGGRVPDTSIKHDQHIVDETVRLNQIIQNAAYRSYQKKEACSEAEFICNALGEESRFSRCPTLGSDCEATAAYHQAAADLQHLFEQLTFDNTNYRGGLPNSNPLSVRLPRAYPAPQLAYRTYGSWMAMKLWNSSVESHQKLDALQRSVLHYAVYADDIQCVQHVASIDTQIIKTTGVDVFGMSLLALAVVRDNIEMFNLLLEKGAPWVTLDSEGRSVLALAARFGNIHIISRLLQFRPYPSPLWMTLYLAIEGLHEGPARLILDCFRDVANYDEIGLEIAASLADGKGLYGLATDIRNTKPFFGTASSALRDINEASPGDSTPIGNSQMLYSFDTIDWTQSETTLANTALCAQDQYVFTPEQPVPNTDSAHTFATSQHLQWQALNLGYPNQHLRTFQ